MKRPKQQAEMPVLAGYLQARETILEQILSGAHDYQIDYVNIDSRHQYGILGSKLLMSPL